VWAGFLIAAACPFAVWGVVLSPLGRRALRGRIKRWMIRRFAMTLVFGPLLVVGIVMAVVTTPGEAVATTLGDLVIGFMVSAVAITKGFGRKAAERPKSKMAPGPSPWRLLSFRDRHRVRRLVRTGVVPDDKGFRPAVLDWLHAVDKAPGDISPRQLRVAEQVRGLLGLPIMVSSQQPSVATDVVSS
jgi:hypothetical protein